ncbi:fimbrillin family protein [Phocaeicola barnesiae]|uniref:Fimbrillin family protein n=1 Tax=Phocaeicola barnesiae TaxID=376804 RepID=A0AAW5N548_9BACT|nr:fimbrillin family protein [Phocaeicola barnesiae]MCR8872945.1 fimbrillin family protein [Phocaeicola barnesiae]MDM8254520.1 fimbrillin family protein [Phocaeicola barnesiae]
MKAFNRYVVPLFLASMALLSCGKDKVVEDEEIEIPGGGDFYPDNGNTVSFEAQLGDLSRATDTSFDTGDQIGVFAVVADGTSDKGVIAERGNYADNVRYTYNGSKFTSGNGISIEEGDQYFYHAVYPYVSSAAASFSFTVKNDQRGENYTLSDLCTAQSIATSATLVQLNFSHRLSKVIVNMAGTNWPSGDRKLTLNNPRVSASVDLNDLTFTSTSTRDAVVCSENGTNSFKAILPPQTIGKENFAVLTIGDRNYTVDLSADLVLNSGLQKEITLTYNSDEVVVEFTGDINPWEEEEVDNRFDDVVPPEIRDELEDYITIYNGVNPPNVEGVYFIDPFDLVYSEDGYDSDNWASYYIKFSNQNMTYNTIDYAEVATSGTAESTGKGAFISGSGNNFTAYFNTEGTSKDIYTKTALVISGTKTSSGIKNLYYAFILVEKGYDPDGILMDEGYFRVFKDEDGLSVNSTWPSRTRSDVKGVSIYSGFGVQQ